MKLTLIWLITLLAIAFLSGCATYSGPSMNFSLGFDGIQFGVGIVGHEPKALPATTSLAK